MTFTRIREELSKGFQLAQITAIVEVWWELLLFGHAILSFNWKSSMQVPGQADIRQIEDNRLHPTMQL